MLIKPHTDNVYHKQKKRLDIFKGQESENHNKNINDLADAEKNIGSPHKTLILKTTHSSGQIEKGLLLLLLFLIFVWNLF